MTYILPNPFPGINPTQTQTVTTTTTITTKTEKKSKSGFQPVKAGTKKSHVVFILDGSSSMYSHRDSTINGFNEFLATQVADSKRDEIPTKASLYEFNGRNVNRVFSKKAIQSVEPLNTKTYDPSGMTNLLDAIGSVMVDVNDDLKKSRKRDRESVIICILTDGEENASRSYNNTQIKAMVEAAEGKDWSFMFLGANIDAFAVGSQWGMRTDNTIQYSMNNISETIATASAATSRMKSARSLGLNTAETYATSAFTAAERSNSTKG